MSYPKIGGIGAWLPLAPRATFAALLLGIVMSIPAVAPATAAAIPFVDDPPSSDLGAESSVDARVTLGLELTRTDSGRVALKLRGNRSSRGEQRPFRVNVSIARILCPGYYRLDVAQENSGNGNTATYTALIRLSALDERQTIGRCGVEPPLLPGGLSIAMGTLENDFFVLRSKRTDGGPFTGRLAFESFPECEEPYRLESELDLTDWRRRLDLRMRVIELESQLQGQTIESERC